MGYTIATSISIIHQKRLFREWERKAFRKILEKARVWAEPMSFLQGENEATFDDHNGEAMETIVEQSKRFPSLLLEAYGTGENRADIWAMRIRGGRTEPVKCQLTYPTFMTLLTPEERRAARWKASRHSKCTVALPYDPRIAKALRLVRDLMDNPPASNRIVNARALQGYKVDLLPAVDLLETMKREMMLCVKNEE